MNSKSNTFHWMRQDIMSLIFGLTGVMLLLLGCAFVFHKNGWHLISGLAGFLGGVFLIRAAVTGYKGEWATVVGTFLIVFSGIGLAEEAEKYIQGKSENVAYAIVGFFFLNGLLLLLTGQRTHNYASELQRLKAANSLQASADDPVAPPNPPVVKPQT